MTIKRRKGDATGKRGSAMPNSITGGGENTALIAGRGARGKEGGHRYLIF